MTQTTVDLIIGLSTFFLTCLCNAGILGFFLGGLRAEVRLMADRLAKIEGAFTMIPRGNRVENLSVDLDSVDYRIFRV